MLPAIACCYRDSFDSCEVSIEGLGPLLPPFMQGCFVWEQALRHRGRAAPAAHGARTEECDADQAASETSPPTFSPATAPRVDWSGQRHTVHHLRKIVASAGGCTLPSKRPSWPPAYCANSGRSYSHRSDLARGIYHGWRDMVTCMAFSLMSRGPEKPADDQKVPWHTIRRYLGIRLGSRTYLVGLQYGRRGVAV